jgi:hypothetical protein
LGYEHWYGGTAVGHRKTRQTPNAHLVTSTAELSQQNPGEEMSKKPVPRICHTSMVT